MSMVFSPSIQVAPKPVLPMGHDRQTSWGGSRHKPACTARPIITLIFLCPLPSECQVFSPQTLFLKGLGRKRAPWDPGDPGFPQGVDRLCRSPDASPVLGASHVVFLPGKQVLIPMDPNFSKMDSERAGPRAYRVNFSFPRIRRSPPGPASMPETAAWQRPPCLKAFSRQML